MTGNKDILISLHTHAEGGHVSFGNKNKGEVIGKGEVLLNRSIKVSNVNLVKDLGYNLLSVSQMCDQGNNIVTFDSDECLVINKKTNKVILRGRRCNNVYVVDTNFEPPMKLCLASSQDDTELWHQRLGHAGVNQILKLYLQDLVIGLPRINLEGVKMCEACV